MNHSRPGPFRCSRPGADLFLTTDAAQEPTPVMDDTPTQADQTRFDLIRPHGIAPNTGPKVNPPPSRPRTDPPGRRKHPTGPPPGELLDEATLRRVVANRRARHQHRMDVYAEVQAIGWMAMVWVGVVLIGLAGVILWGLFAGWVHVPS
jgi:hypothetical protein